MKSLITHKYALTKRRLIIIFILCTIMTVSIVTGSSSGFVSDGNVYTPDGARIVMYEDAPESGTPEDYDAISSLRFTAQNLYKSSFFRGDTQGSCSADIGMGMRYTQNVINTRVINGDVMYQEAVSISAAKKTANQRYIEGEHIIYRPSTGVKDNQPIYTDKVEPWTVEQYYANYGAFPNELSKYVISPKTVLAVRDNNAAADALSASVKNSDGEGSDGEAEPDDEDDSDPNAGEMQCEVPQTLVRGSDGYYTFTLTLDPTGSSKYYRNEVKSLASASKHPVFLFVELEIKIDENFYPVSITTTESYDILIPVLGALTCTGTLTETFSSINVVDTVPEQEFFRSKFSETGNGPIAAVKDASDYLMGAFDPYINGEKNLDLSANVSINGVSLNNVKLSANIKTMNIRAAYSGTYVEYADDRVYLTLNKIKGYVSIDKAKELMQNDALKALLAGAALPDFNSYIGPDTLNRILDGCTVETTDGVACVSLPFSLGEGDGKITVDAKLYMDDESMALTRIEGNVSLGGMSLSVSAKPATAAFPAINDGYKCLDGALDMIPEIFELATGDALRVTGEANVAVTSKGVTTPVSVGMDGYIDLTDGNGVKAELTVDYNGIKPIVKYADETVYIELGNIKLCSKASELGGLIDTIKRITGIEIPQSALELLNAITPKTVADYLNILQDLDITENGLDAKLMFATVPAEIIAVKTENGYTLNLSVFTDALKDTALSLDAELAISSADSREVATDGAYINASALMPAVQNAYYIAESGALCADTEIIIGDKAFTVYLQADFSDPENIKIQLTEPTLPLTLTVIGKTVFIELDGEQYKARLSGSLDDAKILKELFDKYIPDEIKPTLDMLFSDELPSVNLIEVINEVLGSIRSLSLDGDILTAEIEYNGYVATLSATTDLHELAIFTELGGKNMAVKFHGVTPFADIAEPSGEFIQVSDFTGLLRAAAPLLEAKGLKLSISAEMLGVEINGEVAVSFDDGAVRASLEVGDVPVDIYVKDGAAYLTVASTAAFKIGTTEAEINELIARLQAALPDVDLSQVETAVDLMFDPMLLLGAKISALPANNGFAIECDLHGVGLDAEFTLAFESETDGALFSAVATAEIAGKKLDLGVDIQAADGVLSGLNVVAGDKRIASINITSTDKQTVAVPYNKYIDALALVDYIAPIRALINDASTAESLTLDLSAYTDEDGNSFDVAGSIKISLGSPLSVYGEIQPFASAQSSEKIYITFTDGKLYVKTGDIMLYFDTANDSRRLYEVLKAYLPDYLAFELGKLLGQEDGYLPEGISPVIDGVNRLFEMTDTSEIVSTLFGNVYAGKAGDSVIKTLLNALKLTDCGDNRIGINLSVLGLEFNVTPVVSAEQIDNVTVGLNIGSLTVGMTVRFAFSDEAISVSAPENAAEYVSVMDFVDAVQNAVSTVTAKDKDGNIAFVIDSFDFDYFIYEIEMKQDENGDPILDNDGNPVPVKDDAGRDKPLTDENGNKVVATKIAVTGKPGEAALKVKFVKQETTEDDGAVKVSYKLNLEAHVVLAISSLTYSSPITLDLYVINDDEHPDGLVFLDYLETNGNGERISLDYKSIMQIAAAVMDILGVNDDTVNMLLGDYRLDIDKTVFESMDISGIGSLRDVLNGLASAVENGKSALGDVQSAWKCVTDAGDVNGLIESRNDIADYLNSAIARLKAVIAAFATDSDDSEKPEDKKPASDLYNMIVRSIKFSSGAETDDNGNAIEGKTFLQAEIDNEIATQTSGTSFVKVSQTNQGDKTVLDRILVKDLDVNTKLLQTFDMSFQAGTDISISVPDDYNVTQGNKTYSNFANIKHLLFDVMNTANMLEFDIGGIDSSDRINLHFSLGSDLLAALDLTVRYNAKVKIMPVGTDENGKAQYKTAAAIEIHNEKSQAKILSIGSTVVLPECTTRLYFYDNVLYVQGIKTWSLSSEKVKKTNKILGIQQYDKADVLRAEYVDVMYTVDELMYMISNDMTKFLDEFLFYLIPLTDSKIAGLVDVKGIIRDQISGSSGSSGDNSKLTVAQVFKGYTYGNGKHSMTIGLAELAGSSSLDDLQLSITGANDGDDNILDNYIATLHVDTTLVNMLTVNLDATLRNTATPVKYYSDAEFTIPSTDNSPTAYSRNELESTGLGTVYLTEDRTLFTYNGVKYAFVDGYTGSDYVIDNGHVRAVTSDERIYYTIEDITSALLADVEINDDGKITSITNRDGGIQWSRIWQSAYESAQA